MIFRYTAGNAKGNVAQGELEADTLQQALQMLASQQLRPLTLQPIERQTGIKRFFGSISLTDKIFLARYLSLMLKVGTDLLSAIKILSADFEKPAMRSFLLEVKENLSKGKPFYLVFAAYPKVFSPVFINLIKAAEVSGNLQQTFDDLSTGLEKEAALRKKVQGAMIYPAILLMLSIGIFAFLSLFALPRIAKVFVEAGIDPPPFSKFVFTIGLFFGEHIWIIMPIGLVLAVVAWFIFFKTLVGRRLGSRFVSHIPVLHGVLRDLAVQRFATTYASLMKAGMPILQVTHITAEVVGSEQFRVSLNRIAEEGITKGLSLGEAFKREPVFPSVVSNLISIAEKGGHLQEVLETVGDFYATNVDSEIKSLVSIIEPLLLIFMGLMVGSIAIAIIVPIYQLTTQF